MKTVKTPHYYVYNCFNAYAANCNIVRLSQQFNRIDNIRYTYNIVNNLNFIPQ